MLFIEAQPGDNIAEPRVTVTNEMVDRALAAFFKPFYKDNAGDKVAMRIALEAALNK